MASERYYLCLVLLNGVWMLSPRKYIAVWTRLRFAESSTLGANWDMVEFGSTAKNDLIVIHGFMGEGETSYFTVDIFIPVAEERGQH